MAGTHSARRAIRRTPTSMPTIPDLPEFFKRLPRFGDQLRDYRTLRGRSIEEVAAAAGLAPSALSDMEMGRRAAPSAPMVKALAAALGLSGNERGTLSNE